MTSLLFITAPNADFKVANRLLMHIRDWDDRDPFDCLHLVCTNNAYDLEPPPEGEDDGNPGGEEDDDDEPPEDSDEPPEGGHNGHTPETIPPISSFDNAWKGSSVADIEAFCLNLAKNETRGVNGHLFLILDSHGLDEKTVIVAERRLDDDTDEPVDVFNKVRVAWDQAYTVWCNLDIANCDFEDYCDQDEGPDGESWWKFERDGGADITTPEGKARRDEEIQKLVDEGKA